MNGQKGLFYGTRCPDIHACGGPEGPILIYKGNNYVQCQILKWPEMKWSLPRSMDIKSVGDMAFVLLQ